MKTSLSIILMLVLSIAATGEISSNLIPENSNDHNLILFSISAPDTINPWDVNEKQYVQFNQEFSGSSDVKMYYGYFFIPSSDYQNRELWDDVAGIFKQHNGIASLPLKSYMEAHIDPHLDELQKYTTQSLYRSAEYSNPGALLRDISYTGAIDNTVEEQVFVVYECYGDYAPWINANYKCTAVAYYIDLYDCEKCSETCLVDYAKGYEVDLFQRIGDGSICRTGTSACEGVSDCKNMFSLSHSPDANLHGLDSMTGIHCEKNNIVNDPAISFINSLSSSKIGQCQSGAETWRDCDNDEIYGSATQYQVKVSDGSFRTAKTWGVLNGNCVLGECSSPGDCISSQHPSVEDWVCLPQELDNAENPNAVGTCKYSPSYADECSTASDCQCSINQNAACDLTFISGRGNYKLCSCTDIPIPPNHCQDGIQNYGELGVDCGGPCPTCGAPPLIIGGGGCDGFSLLGLCLPGWLGVITGVIFILIILIILLVLVYMGLKKLGWI